MLLYLSLGAQNDATSLYKLPVVLVKILSRLIPQAAIGTSSLLFNFSLPLERPKWLVFPYSRKQSQKQRELAVSTDAEDPIIQHTVLISERIPWDEYPVLDR